MPRWPLVFLFEGIQLRPACTFKRGRHLFLCQIDQHVSDQVLVNLPPSLLPTFKPCGQQVLATMVCLLVKCDGSDKSGKEKQQQHGVGKYFTHWKLFCVFDLDKRHGAVCQNCIEPGGCSTISLNKPCFSNNPNGWIKMWKDQSLFFFSIFV